MKFKLNPLQQFTLFLAVYSGFAVWFNFGETVIWHLAATLGFGVALFYLLSAITKKKKSIWNTVATALIIFLLLNPGAEIHALIAMGIAVPYKFFFEYKGKPIINPAVFALLLLISVVSLFPEMKSPFVSWWGASFGEPLAVTLLLVWILAGLGAWKKWPLFLSFLIPYAAFTYFYGGFDFTKFIFTSGTIYFLAGVMLIEPKSSPVFSRQQILCGACAAVAYSALFYYKVGGAELIAIAVMNLLNFAINRLPAKP